MEAFLDKHKPGIGLNGCVLQAHIKIAQTRGAMPMM